VNAFLTSRLAVLPLSLESAGKQRADSSTSSLSDDVLFQRLQAGEQEALSFLFQRYWRVVRGIGIRILRDTTEAEDFVQDLFLFIHRKCNIFDRSRSSARSWIVQMAYHRAIERRRHLAHRRFYSQVELEHHAAPVVGTPTIEADYSAEAVFGRNGLGRVLEALSDDQRETLRLHFFEGYTLAEVAQKLGQPLGNVRHHYYRALDKLRKQMFAKKASVNGDHAK
jgi:RNA polymerase sigma-70 factor, ECF subfamily